LRRAAATALAGLALAGCGAGSTPPAAQRPALPPQLAQELRTLENRPEALRAHVIAAVNGKRVPPALQEELLARANAYAEQPSPRTQRRLHALLVMPSP
jgi:hypothetical protein